MLSLITQNEIKAKDKNRKAIPQRQYPCMAGNGEEEVGTADMRSTPKTAWGGGAKDPKSRWELA